MLSSIQWTEASTPRLYKRLLCCGIVIWGLSSAMIAPQHNSIHAPPWSKNPPKTECGCLSGGVLENGHTRKIPSSHDWVFTGVIASVRKQQQQHQLMFVRLVKLYSQMWMSSMIYVCECILRVIRTSQRWQFQPGMYRMSNLPDSEFFRILLAGIRI